MLTHSVESIEIARLHFDEFDQMVEWTLEVGWDNSGTQLTAGPNRIIYDNFYLPGLMVAHFRVQQSIQNIFAVEDGMVVFLICREKLPLLWSGRHFPATMLGIVRSGIEHDVVLPAGWDCYEFTVSEQLIHRTEIFPSEFFAKTRRLEHAFLPLTEPITGHFLSSMDEFFRRAQDLPSSNGARISEAEFSDFVIRGLYEVIDAGLGALGSVKLLSARRPDLVTNSRELLAAQPTLDITAEKLAQDLGVSYRVLNYAFKDSLGISPYQYILNQRLQSARKHLKSGISVTEASLMNGFYTPSRFSRHYRRMFGELPSETLRSA